MRNNKLNKNNNNRSIINLRMAETPFSRSVLNVLFS